MNILSIQFSKEQLEFLSVFFILKEPVSLNIVNALAPLLPATLLDTIQYSIDHQILQKTKDGLYKGLSKLPFDLENQLKEINNKKRASNLIDQLNQLQLSDQLSPDIHYNLIKASERGDGGKFEIEIAESALKTFDHHKAMIFYEKAINRLSTRLDETSCIQLLIPACLTYSDLCFALGQKFIEGYRFLEIAKSVAAKLGDQRSEALIHLHLGRIMYVGNRRHESVELMKSAVKVIFELGDEDIKNRASEFIALYYYMRGRFKDSLYYFEICIQAFENQEHQGVANMAVPVFYGYCSAYLGQFHKAIGYLDSAWRRAKRDSNQTLSTTIRATLGTMLLLIDKQHEASVHLEEAIIEAEENNNLLAKHFANGGIMNLFYREGRPKEASELMKSNTEDAKKAGLHYQYSSPWFVEMFFDFVRLGKSPLSLEEMTYEVERLLKDPSAHLNGVTLRLIAEASLSKEFNQDWLRQLKILAEKSLSMKSQPGKTEFLKILLKESESKLIHSGDPVQLAKTRIQMARLKLNSGNKAEAGKLAQKAREGLSGFWEDYFPDGIRALLETHEEGESDPDTSLTDHKLFQLIGELVPSLKLDEFLDRLTFTMNKFFGAERGGLFWSSDGKIKSLALHVSRNLNKVEAQSPGFSPSLKHIQKCFKTGHPYISQPMSGTTQANRPSSLAILCMPLKSQGRIKGVLYHDNSYLSDCFDSLDLLALNRLSELLSVHIDRMHSIENQVKEVRHATLENTFSYDQNGNQKIQYQSQEMQEVLNRVERVAQSDTAVLIQGETGVGKELLAERVHQTSLRNKKPFIIVDPTTIPDNLVESELFGHEKGSFTGADRQKKGRIELADRGTLFIDEIGEIPKSIQAKLLRVLQEKTYSRIGSNQSLTSDFRLVAATNRNLVEEVAKGTFREDLFYRINIIPVTLPPLRERSGDILLLTRYFLDRFSKKYHRTNLELTPDMKQTLSNYHWPGNIRELINVIERSVILSNNNQFELLLETKRLDTPMNPFSGTPTLDEIQRRYLEYVLIKTAGRIAGKKGAADILGLKPSTLYHRMGKLGISR